MAASIRQAGTKAVRSLSSFTKYFKNEGVQCRALSYFRSPIEYDYKYKAPSKTKPKPAEDKTDIFTLQRAEEILQSNEMDVLKSQAQSDMPLSMLPNPYAKPPTKCILCEHKVDLDYKNVRLLSQFVSPYTGQIYGRHVTGLCVYMQQRVAQLIKRSRYFGYMPYTLKTPKYLKDPRLFDPFRKKF